MLGDGNGGFQSPLTFNSGGLGSVDFALADVNGDGKLDVVDTNSCAVNDCNVPALAVLLGNGDGTFASPNVMGAYEGTLALVDVNGDGKPDLLLQEGGLLVMLGSGNGTFSAPQSYSEGDGGGFVMGVSDVNGDGHLDVVSLNPCVTGYDCKVAGFETLLGNGDGTFVSPRNFIFPNSEGFLTSIASGDVNEDGKLDLLVTEGCFGPPCGNDGEGILAVFTGVGDGTFLPFQSYDLGIGQPASLTLADMNWDGKLDVLATSTLSGGPEGGFVLLLGNGDGTFQPVNVFDSGGWGANYLAVADVNGDGKPDVVVTNSCSSTQECGDPDFTIDGTVGVLLGNGDGTFQPVVAYDSGGQFANSIAIADVNDDGKLDLVVLNRCASESGCHSGDGAVAILLGNGDGTFQPAQVLDAGGYYASSLAVADVNHDGKLDIVVVEPCVDSQLCDVGVNATGVLAVFLGRGDGTFLPPITQTTPYMTGPIAIADFNDDGKLDLAVGDGALLFLGKGNGRFNPPTDLGANGPIAVGDFNRDGKLDVAAGVTILLHR